MINETALQITDKAMQMTAITYANPFITGIPACPHVFHLLLGTITNPRMFENN